MCNSDVPRIGPRMILVQRHWVADWKLWLVWFTASYALPTLCNADVPRIGPRMILVQRQCCGTGLRIGGCGWRGSRHLMRFPQRSAQKVLLREHMREAPHNQAELVTHLGRWVARDGNLYEVAAASWELELDIDVFGPI